MSPSLSSSLSSSVSPYLCEIVTVVQTYLSPPPTAFPDSYRSAQYLCFHFPVIKIVGIAMAMNYSACICVMCIVFVKSVQFVAHGEVLTFPIHYLCRIYHLLYTVIS